MEAHEVSIGDMVQLHAATVGACGEAVRELTHLAGLDSVRAIVVGPPSRVSARYSSAACMCRSHRLLLKPAAAAVPACNGGAARNMVDAAQNAVMQPGWQH
jgi:hypothetical protein